MAKSKLLRTGTDDYVYDISLDGTFVDALSGIICHNTDGFNFQLPDSKSFRYTKDNPYIGKGSNREVKLGKEYTGFEADVAEFNDIYMKDVHSPIGVQKMGLGIDEVVASTINFARKNYADYFPENTIGKEKKLVGNTIKSKRLNAYIAHFLDKAVTLLLQGKGKDFIKEYYDYIEKLYNYKIPVRDIASKGKVKKTLAQYQEGLSEITKAGRPKSRQAWYELAIHEGISVNTGDTIYYINTGKSKSHPDVKKVTHYVDLEGNEITKEVDRGYNKYNKENKGNKKKLPKTEWLIQNYPNAKTEEEIILNCVLVPREIIDADDDIYCSDVEGYEYNTIKYIDAFNKRITPLLVCFSRAIRDKILITKPEDRQYFTEEECYLVHGEPNKPGDQDTFEQLMTMEDKEIRFWTKYNMVPPFLEECGMGRWEDIVADYDARMQHEKELGIDKEKQELEQTISELSSSELNEFIEEGEVPSSILKIADLDPSTFALMSKTYPEICIGTLVDILDVIESRKSDAVGEIEQY